MKRRRDLPLVYSCSGCSSAAQMTNWLAVQLDRRGIAEMSCIAGVGGDVPSLVRKARSDRPVVAIDGCVLQCARNCLARHGVTPAVHHLLSDDGVRKRLGEDFAPEQAEQVLEGLIARIARVFRLDQPGCGRRCVSAEPSGVRCVQLQGGGGSRRGASATDDNAADVRAGPRDARVIQTTGPKETGTDAPVGG